MVEDRFMDWKEREALAEAMIPLIGQLYRNHHVVTSIYGRPIINRSVINLLKAHKFVRLVEDSELSVHETYPVLEILVKLDLGPSRVDIGKLAVDYHREGNGLSLEDYITQKVAGITNGNKQPLNQGHDVVLYGFGRIGRLMARLLIERAGGGSGLNLRAVVVRPGGADNDLQKRASLLRRDSVHGSFQGTISVDEENNIIYANGVGIQIIYSNAPDSIEYTQYGINNAIVVDNTGKWRDKDGLGLHLKAQGISRVLLTAPGKGDIKNIV
ncbi:MAG: glyceraldehyde 3-phosphate dehydrogenase NAD-binding domain-containing protein, partial [Endozoicomonas sp.]